MWPYENSEEALTDALRLSRGMTYKNALAGLDYGGGKAVIIGDPGHDKSPELLRAFGNKIDALGGLYITGEDVGLTPADMEIIADTTTHVRGTAQNLRGDPSPRSTSGTAWARAKSRLLLMALHVRRGVAHQLRRAVWRRR